MPDLPQLVRDIRSRIAALAPVMSREEIAPRLGVAYSWLSKFMQQTTANPRVSTLEKVLLGLRELEGETKEGRKKVNGVQRATE